MGYLIFIQPATAPKFERKPIYWILSEVAKRLGRRYAIRNSPKDVLRSSGCSICTPKCVAKDADLPTYDELKRLASTSVKTRTGTLSPTSAFRQDPEANPLKTPSGKIEIYSSRLADIAAKWQLEKDETISPLPVYASTFEGWDDPLRGTFPLQLFGFHFKARTHSSYGNVDVLKAACRQEVWFNPLDAQKRGIRTVTWCACLTAVVNCVFRQKLRRVLCLG